MNASLVVIFYRLDCFVSTRLPYMHRFMRRCRPCSSPRCSSRTTHVTGIWGIYHAPTLYSTIDDLITNTLDGSGMLGYAVNIVTASYPNSASTRDAITTSE